MTVYEDWIFDETLERNPVDRAVVDKIRQYADERGGTIAEFDGIESGPQRSNFVFGWNGRHVGYFRCMGSFKASNHSGCKIEIEPPNMLKELRYLRTVWINRYSENLAWLGELAGLEEILISPTPDTTERFPMSWDSASTLRKLNLGYSTDSADHIPSSVRSLKELCEINIWTWDEKSLILPDWLGEFSRLKSLRLRGRFVSIPRSLTQTGLPFMDKHSAKHGIILENVTLSDGDVSMYLSNDHVLIDAFYEGEQASIRECKVIFLGDGGAGKSSLIERIMTDSFALGKLPTDGMRVIKWDADLGGRPFRLRFLDFGGQEIMHSMHRCFLSDHTVYVLVCAVRDDTQINAVASRWLEQVRTYAPNCPVILALNKADENPDISVDETSLRVLYPSLKQVLKTSAAKDKGSPFYAGHLLNEIMKLAPCCVQGLRGSKAMLTVKRTLEDMGSDGENHRNYITAQEYEKLCANNGIHSKELQFSMLKWFRDLGVAYFYRSNELDVQLESLRVLNPVWLTNGIYRLILRTKDRVQNGVLSHDDIRAVLATPYRGDAEESLIYTNTETEYVLHVMRMFRISHEMKEEGKELIPMLMNKETPAVAMEFPRREVHLRWEGAFLPNNLIHRLMVEKYAELDFQCMWRTGARFRSPGSGGAALVVMDDRDYKALDLYVAWGNAEEKREYLRRFREKIQEILHSLNLRETKEYLCFEINGKEGKLPYNAITTAWRNGDKRIMFPDIVEYASPAELLLMVETDPEKRKALEEREKALREEAEKQPEKEKIQSETALNRAQTAQTYAMYFLLLMLIILVLILLARGVNPQELLPNLS